MRVTLKSLLLLILLTFLVSVGTLPATSKSAPVAAHPAQSLQIYALDVGQGDSLLIVSPTGKNVLIDAGPPTAGSAVVDALHNHNITRLDLVVASHPHNDHIGRTKAVLETFPVARFLDSGRNYTTVTFRNMIRTIRDRHIPFVKAAAGQTFDIGGGASLKVLNPHGGDQWITHVRPGGSVENANSVVLRLTYRNFSMLFTGDAEAETEAEMIGRHETLSAQILKVGHHGSKYATSPEFLNAVNPKDAIISCGTGNDYGHPTQETLDRLQAQGTTIYRTDLNGEIAITTEGNDYKIEPARQQERNLRAMGRRAVKDEFPAPRAPHRRRRSPRTRIH